MKSSKFWNTSNLLSVLAVVLMVLADQAAASQPELRVRRHAASASSGNNRKDDDFGLVTSSGASMAMSTSGILAAAAAPANKQVGSISRPVMSSSTSTLVSGADDEELRPNKKPNRLRGPKGNERRPVESDDEYDRRAPPRRHDDERDCEDDDDNNDDRDQQDAYGGMFQSMAANPMRHFRRMMNNVFDQFPTDFGLHRDDYNGRDYDDGGYRTGGGRRLGDPAVASSAAAASFDSRDGGYSKLSSSVTSNGRTRGIISETRNGRTKTRRIGDDSDDIDE